MRFREAFPTLLVFLPTSFLLLQTRPSALFCRADSVFNPTNSSRFTLRPSRRFRLNSFIPAGFTQGRLFSDFLFTRVGGRKGCRAFDYYGALRPQNRLDLLSLEEKIYMIIQWCLQRSSGAVKRNLVVQVLPYRHNSPAVVLHTSEHSFDDGRMAKSSAVCLNTRYS